MIDIPSLMLGVMSGIIIGYPLGIASYFCIRGHLNKNAGTPVDEVSELKEE